MSDTLSCDTTQLSLWRSDGAYDYGRELTAQQVNLMEWLLQQVENFLNSLFGEVTGHRLTLPLIIIAGLALIGMVGWYICRTHPGLFVKNRRQTDEMEEETIYGIDFDDEIARAVEKNDYTAAVRWVYLQTLRQLSDTGRIEWQLYKTPTQYVYECRHAAFRELTNHFLRVRYGNFKADEPMYHRLCDLQREVMGRESGQKGGET